MEQILKNKLKLLKYDISPEIADKIWEKLIRKEIKINKIKTYFFSSLAIMSLMAMVPVFKLLFNDLNKSGIFDYISIALFYSGSILGYWKELSLSILESLPITSINISFTLIFIFFLSIKYMSKQIIRNQLLTIN